MAIRVAINGFGRIGRLVMRAALEHASREIEIVGINDLGSVETNAHLLRYDSVHGRFAGEVTTGENWMDAGRGKIRVTAERDPAKLPWKELAVDVALECTGIFTKREQAAKHLEAGAKRVIISAPADGADFTVVMGVNHDELNAKHTVISNASCTTNCLAPVAYVLHQGIGIQRGYMTTIHSYTGDQSLQDTLHSDLRRARAAALSLIPTSTGAARGVHELDLIQQGDKALALLAVAATFNWWVDPFAEVWKPGAIADARDGGCLVSQELIGIRYYSFKLDVFAHKSVHAIFEHGHGLVAHWHDQINFTQRRVLI